MSHSEELADLQMRVLNDRANLRALGVEIAVVRKRPQHGDVEVLLARRSDGAGELLRARHGKRVVVSDTTAELRALDARASSRPAEGRGRSRGTA